MTEDVRQAKNRIRARARAARAALSPAERATRSAAIGRWALALPRVPASKAVLAYGATPEEADPTPLLDVLRSGGARVGMPRVAGATLTLHWVTDERELEVGTFGLRQPREDAPAADPAAFDLVLVPGVAFDAEGRRLGYGAGYYDRLLPLVPNALTVGLAFDEQLVECVPEEPHDARLDIVATPSGLFGPQAAAGL